MNKTLLHIIQFFSFVMIEKKLQGTKSSLKAERLKQKLGIWKQAFHYDSQEVFEPVTENQKQNQTKQQKFPKKQIQALRDFTQTTTQAIKKQTRAIEHSSDISNKNIRKSFEEGKQEYDEVTNRNEVLTSFVNSSQIDFSIVQTVSKIPNNKNKSQFSLEPVEGSSNLFTINPFNTQQVQIKGSTLTFQNGNIYNLKDPDPEYFLGNTQLDREKQIKKLNSSFLNDLTYNIFYGDKKPWRF